MEFFSGTGTIAEAFRRRGHDVLTIDADPEHEADLRLAFDHPNLTEDITRAVHYITEAGIPKSKIMVYALFNFKDTPREAEARMRTLVDLGVRVYPQQYVPLDQLERHPRYIGKHWTQQLAHKFRMFYLLMGEYKKMDFPQHLLNSYPHPTKDWEEGG